MIASSEERRPSRPVLALMLLGLSSLFTTEAFLSSPPTRRPAQSPRLLPLRASASTEPGSIVKLDKNPIIICPAQFGTAQDYMELVEELESRGHPAVAVDLGRFDWLKITQSVFTPDYWQGTLKPVGALDFYFDAMKATVGQVKQQYPGRKVNLVGEFWEQLDQTRGLLRYVTDRFPGAYHQPDIKYICVCGTSTPGAINGLEEGVAYISYLPLCGEGESIGDGIVPESIAFLDGAVQVRIPGVKHANFIPTAGPSIQLPNYVWYGTSSIVDQWIVHLP